jgi:hypothetical protein
MPWETATETLLTDCAFSEFAAWANADEKETA